MNITKTENALI